MASFDRILLAYERGLKQLGDDVEAGVAPDPDEREQLRLLNELLQALVRSYASFQLDRRSSLEASTSVMYAASAAGDYAPLNVSLDSLVEAGSLTDRQARFLRGAIGMKRTILVTGRGRSGKSTLLNALIRALPVDQRLVAVETKEDLMGLRERSFTTRLPAREGDESMRSALTKAKGMHPTWLLVSDLRPSDGTVFLQAVADSGAGLATVIADDPNELLVRWTNAGGETGTHLQKLRPFVVQMGRDSDGRPILEKISEVNAAEGGIHLEEKAP